MSELKQAWEYSFIHSSATGRGDEEIGPCLTYEKAVAFGKGCIKQREVFMIDHPEINANVRDAALESAVQAVMERAGDAEKILVISAFEAIRKLKTNRFARHEKPNAIFNQNLPPPVQGLDAAIRALPCAVPEELMGHQAAVFGYKRGFNSAMSGASQLAIAFAALASPADALVAGDEVDARKAVFAAYSHCLANGDSMLPQEIADHLIAAIQAQKDGHAE